LSHLLTFDYKDYTIIAKEYACVHVDRASRMCRAKVETEVCNVDRYYMGLVQIYMNMIAYISQKLLENDTVVQKYRFAIIHAEKSDER